MIVLVAQYVVMCSGSFEGPIPFCCAVYFIFSFLSALWSFVIFLCGVLKCNASVFMLNVVSGALELMISLNNV